MEHARHARHAHAMHMQRTHSACAACACAVRCWAATPRPLARDAAIFTCRRSPRRETARIRGSPTFGMPLGASTLPGGLRHALSSGGRGVAELRGEQATYPQTTAHRSHHPIAAGASCPATDPLLPASPLRRLRSLKQVHQGMHPRAESPGLPGACRRPAGSATLPPSPPHSHRPSSMAGTHRP
eukprot:6121983-Prymnesium_polylepis.2